MKTNRENDTCRCPWVDLSKVDYVEYHDKEWGVPVYDDRLLFEFLTLESVQAGLSWYTVLKKRENYRRAFENFEPEKIARFDQARIEALLLNPGIIRNRLKIALAFTKSSSLDFRSFQCYPRLAFYVVKVPMS